jgi:hypothetical protein
MFTCRDALYCQLEWMQPERDTLQGWQVCI